MTPEELKALRTAWELTQTQMATYMGLTRRTYIGLEVGESPLRHAHILSIERMSVDVALAKRDPDIIPEGFLQKIRQISNMLSDSPSVPHAEEPPSEASKSDPNAIPKTTRVSHNRRIDHNAILDRWAAGWGIQELANYGQTTPGTIYELVRNHRRRGDPRAANRK